MIARDLCPLTLVLGSGLAFSACAAATISPASLTPPSPSSVVSDPSVLASRTLPSPSASPPSTPSTAPSLSQGFAFAADDVVAYYESVGYTCSATRKSTVAVGFDVRTCQRLEPTGRTLGIGVVTDAAGRLANGFASVQAAAAEPVLEPLDALDPLAGFLGATLGEQQGAALLEWLAGHLGDTYAETTIGPIKVASYTAAPDDHSTLYVELANQAYLDAPTPGSS